MLSLVIPVYRNEASIAPLLDAVAALQGRLPEPMECVFVVDGSPDRSYELLRQGLAARPFASKLVLLSRNFGAFQAIRTGLSAAQGDRFAIMAADLQEPPDLVIEIARVLREEPADVVVGIRDAREDPWHVQMSAGIYWWLYRRYVVREMPPGGVDIFGCNRHFRDTLLLLEERHSSLVAQVFWLGFRRRYVPYVRQKRQHGKSAWTFEKKLSYMMDSVFAFTNLPIRLLTWAGGLGATAAFILGLAVFVAKLLGKIAVPGYAVTILTITFLGGVNLFGLGIVGSYAWRAYENTKHRPHAVVLREESFHAGAVGVADTANQLMTGTS